MSERTVEQQHNPDRSRITKALQPLEWQQLPLGDDVLWEDGSRLLAAVPICGDVDDPNGKWYYEYAIVTIRCDEDCFEIEANGGDPWGWSLSDIDYLVVLDVGPCRDTENGPVKIDAEQSDLDSLRKDAERYRKLRASDGWKDSPLIVVNNSQNTRCEKLYHGDRLDAVVDAMA